MNFSEEGYSGRRPRFLGNDDIVNLMQAGTAGNVDTINRTGEKLAAAYGSIPKLFGEGIRGGVEGFYKGKKDALTTQIAEEERARAKESFEQGKELTGLQIAAAKRSEENAKEEDEWYDSPFMAPGQSGPLPPKGLGMSRRQTMRDATMGDSLADITRKGELFSLNKTQAEEAIAASKAQRQAAAASLARGATMDNFNLQQARRGDFVSQFKGALMTQDTALLPQIEQAALAAKFTPEQINAMKAEAQTAHQAARGESEMVQQTITPEGQALTAKLNMLDQDIQGLARVSQKVKQYKAANQTPFLSSATTEGQETFQNLKKELANFNPEAAANLKTVGDFELSRGLSGGSFFEGAEAGVDKLTNRVLSEAEANLDQIELEAQKFQNQRILAQVAGKRAQLQNLRKLMAVGADPNTHNSDPLMPQQQQQFFSPRGQP